MSQRSVRDRDEHWMDDDAQRWAQCPDCTTPDPQRRSAHQLDLARLGGLDYLRSHLTEQYVKLRPRGKERPDAVDGACAWVANLIALYSGLVDQQTGARLEWWEARQRSDAA